MRVLDEKTFVPLSVLAAMASFVFWLATVDVNSKANASAITDLAYKTHEDFATIRDEREKYESSLSVHIRDQDKLLREMTDRLGRIEGKLDTLRRDRD